MKPNFDRAENIARELRLYQKGNSLSLDIRKMIFDKPIIIDTFQNYSKLTNTPLSSLTINGQLKDGYTIIVAQIYIILYNECKTYSERLNWTLAHEVGHIYLEHEKDGRIEEIEANWFAAELLAPEIIIWTIAKNQNTLSSSNIHNIFNISYQASSKRLDSIQRKYMCNPYLKNELLHKYEDKIRII